jgi:AcrR family transcriptional regulator
MARKSTTHEAKQEMLRQFMETTIAQAAKAVFAERGYQGATLEEIAQRAGMSKATIYIYYENKDALFLQVVEELVHTAMTETAQTAESAKPPLEKLAGMVRGKITFYEREREFFRIYLNEKQGLEATARVLQEGIEAGELRPMDSRRLAFYLQEMISTVLVQRILGQANTSVDEDIEQVLDLFLHGARQPLH